MKYDPVVECVPGEAWRYFVNSKSSPDQRHLVDLTDNFPLGSCGCADYVCRRLPNYRKTGNPIRCLHLNAARELIVNYLIKSSATTTTE